MPDADPRRWVAPEALADVILFLASDAARAIHGAAIPVTASSEGVRDMTEVFICDAVRTPFGRYGGALSSIGQTISRPFRSRR